MRRARARAVAVRGRILQGLSTTIDGSLSGGASDAAGDYATPAGYELGGVLGRGGMGEVVLARDLRIGRDVAIKRMHASRENRELAARFLREAKIQAPRASRDRAGLRGGRGRARPAVLDL